jgi:hypothetical protein
VVKKSSFLDKLRNRWRSPSGMRVEGAPRDDGRSEVLASLPAAPEPVEPAGRAKLTPQQDAMLALGEGFKELASLLRGVQTRLETQGELNAAFGARVEQLPVLAAAQLEALRGLAQALERQQALGDAVLARLGDLPQALAGVQRALDRAAATDERAVRTFDEFRATMDRIHGSIGEMVQSSRTQAQATQALVQDQRAGQQRLLDTLGQDRERHATELRGAVDGLGRTQQESLRRVESVTQDGLGALRRAQEDQSTRMTKLVAEQSRLQRAVLVFAVLSLLVLIGIAALLALR